MKRSLVRRSCEPVRARSAAADGFNDRHRGHEEPRARIADPTLFLSALHSRTIDSGVVRIGNHCTKLVDTLKEAEESPAATQYTLGQRTASYYIA